MELKPQKRFIKNVEIFCSNLEFNRLKTLLEQEEHSHIISLANILQTDDNGMIMIFTPNVTMSWSLVFLFQNMMISQRNFFFANKINRLEARIKELESK